MKIYKTRKTPELLTMNLQFFGETEGAGAASEATATDNAGETTQQDSETTKSTDDEAMRRHIQSEVDKKTAEQGKTIATLQKEIANLKKANMSAEEIRKQEQEDKDKQLAAKEQELTERENRLYALDKTKAIDIGGMGLSVELAQKAVEVIMDTTQEGIDKRLEAFNDLFKEVIAVKTKNIFKENGRTPNGGSAGGSLESKQQTVAEKLGKQAAERNKAANDVLSKYGIGG